MIKATSRKERKEEEEKRSRLNCKRDFSPFIGCIPFAITNSEIPIKCHSPCEIRNEKKPFLPPPPLRSKWQKDLSIFNVNNFQIHFFPLKMNYLLFLKISRNILLSCKRGNPTLIQSIPTGIIKYWFTFPLFEFWEKFFESKPRF